MKVSTCGEIKVYFNDGELFDGLDEDIQEKLDDDFDKGSQPSYN